MNVFGDDVSIEQFFQEYWRKRPLVIKGGAEQFLGRRWTATDFDQAYRKLAAGSMHGASVNERPNDVTFIERVSAIEDDLKVRMRALGGLFGTPEPWCDTIRTYRPSGIGSHFDHSDNFVLQQDGVKNWRLASPENITRQDYVRRMMGHAGVGQQELPEGDSLFEVDLEPGDVLYIPLMWLHSGLSEQASLSLSVVCPVVSIYSAVVPVLAKLMRERGVGHQTIEAIPDWLPAADRIAAGDRVRAATRALLAGISTEQVLAELEDLQGRSFFPGLATN